MKSRLLINILSKLSQEHILFILMHRTGFLTECVNSAIELVIQGITFAVVERYVHKRKQQFVTSLVQVVLHGSYPFDMNSWLHESAVKLVSEPVPSNNIIRQCFIVHFMETEKHITITWHCCLLEKISDWIIPFKRASNIGFVHSGGKWVTLYNSVFIALYEVG